MQMYAKRALTAVAVTVLAHGTSMPQDACSLLTLAEVNAVLGAKLEAGTHPLGDPLVCGWAEVGGATITNKRVQLEITSPAQYAVAKTARSNIINTPVSGLGDDAFYATVGALGTFLNVKKGSNAFNINVKGEGWSVDQKLAMEKALAADVLAKL